MSELKLTREAIAALTGRDLDVAVGEFVMGWTNIRVYTSWRPSENIEQAILVLDKARGHGPFVIYSAGTEYGCWMVNPAWMIHGTTISEAICRAALMATVGE